jgi:hypothetical protein
VQLELALGDRVVEPSLVFRRRAFELIGEGLVDLLDVKM